jgi:hypothetical protein
MTPAKDRSIVFELSPYAPAGLDIVPVPVPRGMDDWFADLFGNSPKGPEPGDMLGASDDSSGALRDAVLQMLHGGGAPQSIGTLSPMAQGEIEDSNSLRAADSALSSTRLQSELIEPTGTRIDSQSEAPSDAESARPAAKLTAGSMLGLFVAGMGQAIRQRGRRRSHG